MPRSARHLVHLCALSLTPLSLLAQTTGRAKELPVKYAGPPTVPAITAGDLMTRLYIYADDSLMGRQFGTPYNVRATAYIEREVRRLGLMPAGDSGGYFQNLPVSLRALDPASTITVGGTVFKAGTDFIAASVGRAKQFTNTEVVFGGAVLDTTNLLPNEAVRGKIVVMRAGATPSDFRALVQSAGFRAYQQALAGAFPVTILGDEVPAIAVRNVMNPTRAGLRGPQADQDTPIQLQVTTRVADALFGAPVSSLAKGAAGKALSSDVHIIDRPGQARNVVAILPGSDPALKGQYVAIGAHNDHIGFNGAPVDHDSLRAFMQVVRPQGADSPNRKATDAEAARIRAVTDSLHALHGARADSISNGADDDGSGTVSVLEVAEAFAKAGGVKPKRSIVFVWHTGEEAGLLGSAWFTDHPTVPRDSIVAQLNMDMVGRGAASDITGEDKAGGLLHGGPGYLQLVGSRRLSTELGDLIETVNKEQKLGFVFDYGMDANGHPQNIYCRSDHYEYARYGIPIVFMTTGGHADYHQVTDEPQYIDYAHMADVAKLVFASALRVANLDHRVVVDQPKPDPKGRCVQ
jgi:peptidase M28-like protein